MVKIVPTLSAMILVGSLARSALAADGILLREPGDQDYCHIKFEAIRPETLDSNQPQLQPSDAGDVIDFYGACDESPTGMDQVVSQKRDEQFRFGRDYED
jgi:hypothetical protein